MQTHLDEMISLFEVSSDGEFRALAPSKESIENGKLSAAMTHFSAIEGASGPPGDMTTKPCPRFQECRLKSVVQVAASIGPSP